MTIKEYVEQHNKMGINDWIEVIKKDGLEHLEDKILAVADKLDKITINHNADFVSAIKSSWTKVLKASIDSDKCNKIIDLLKDNNVDVDDASPNFVALFADDYGYELTSDEVVYISDNYVKGYGVEYRNMQTAINHVIVTDTKEKAEQILELLEKTLQEETNKQEIQFIWEDINTLANDNIEVDYREAEENNGIYKGIKVINYDKHIPDIWE